MARLLREVARSTVLFISIGGLAACSAALAQHAAQESTQGELGPPLTAKIKAGSIDAILEAGASGDKRYLSILRPIVRRALPVLHSASGSAQMAMAKLGDAEQMKSIVCELSYSEVRVQDEALQKLRYIGGYGSVKVLASLLTENQRNNQLRWDPIPAGRKRGELQAGRRASIPFSRLVMETLSAMVGGPELPSPKDSIERAFPTEKERKTWREWLDQNDAKLKTLEPTYLIFVERPDECLHQEQEEQKALENKHKKLSDESNKNK